MEGHACGEVYELHDNFLEDWTLLILSLPELRKPTKQLKKMTKTY